MVVTPTDQQRGLAIVSRLTLIALIAGLVGGTFAHSTTPGLDLLDIAHPVGRLWLDALTMTIVPLVFGLLVIGIARAAGTATGNHMVSRAVLWFAVLLVSACLLAAAATSMALGFFPVSTEAMLADPGGAVPALATPSAWFTGIIPTNPIKAAAESAMVPLVVFALLFGLALARIENELRAAMLNVLTALVEAMLVIVRWVLTIAPIGVFALAFGVGARVGAPAAGAFAHYMILVASICLLATLLAYVAAVLAGRISLLGFARAAAPAQIVALSTQSSLAALPVMIAAAPALRVSENNAGVILPLAVSLFRAASAAANVAVAIYLAHLHGIPVGAGAIMLGALVAVPVSLAAVGLPAQVSFFATIGPVCIAMGVPLTTLPLLLALETIPDIFRTLGNVTADLAVLRIAGRDREDVVND